MCASQVVGHQQSIPSPSGYSVESIEAVSNALLDLTSDFSLAAFCTPDTIERYLKARNGDINAAEDMLR